MDKEGFRNFLQSIELNDEQIDTSISIAERFTTYVNDSDRISSEDTAWTFSKLLIEEGNNTRGNYIALIRYCWFIKNNEMFAALMELVDGGEVNDNLYRRVAARFGTKIRDEVFAGNSVAPYGTPSPDKPAFLHPVIDRLKTRVGDDACKEFLSSSLRNLPDENFLSEREKFHQSSDVDAYLDHKKKEFINRLEASMREGRLFFTQEVTQKVIDFVYEDPEIGGGRREGNIIYVTKIPYMTKQYLLETDPTLRRYYYCHCPWVRDAIKNNNVKLAEIFCQCSGGFHKKPWEVIFEQPLQVEVLESVLKGDNRCRFAIFLPGDKGK